MSLLGTIDKTLFMSRCNLHLVCQYYLNWFQRFVYNKLNQNTHFLKICRPVLFFFFFIFKLSMIEHRSEEAQNLRQPALAVNVWNPALDARSQILAQLTVYKFRRSQFLCFDFSEPLSVHKRFQSWKGNHFIIHRLYKQIKERSNT